MRPLSRTGRALARPVVALGRLGTRLARPLTDLGRVAAAVAVAAGLAGWALGWPELTAVAAACAGALTAAALLTVGRSTYAVRLSLADHRVSVGERAVGSVAVRNVSRRRLLPARIEVPVGRSTVSAPLPSLAPGAEYEDVFAISTVRRAVVPVGPVRATRGDPFGLMRRWAQWGRPLELYVHPEVVALSGAASGVLRDLEGQATREISNSDMSFHALRDYAAGDDRRHIHWRSTARLGALMVRQFEDTRRTHTAIALSTATADYADDAEFELAVSVAASVGVQELREDRDLTFLAGTRLRAEGTAGLLDEVSGLVLAPDGRGADALARWIRTAAPQASVAILVVGSRPTTADLRARARLLPTGVRTIVLICESGAALEVADRANLAVARLGALADLPRVARRVVSG